MATDMTAGKILPQLVRFTIPLVLGNLFQLTYNAADSIIVGKFVGDSALAAVGTAGPIMNLVILFISGMCMGAGILMSAQFGGREYGRLERQISTTLLGGLAFSLLVTVAMVFLSAPVLRLIQVQEAILRESAGYLRIIFLGLAFTFVYNFFSNTLRALGDSRTPLYFLILSSVFNIVGDLVLVAGLGWGVYGSAVATVLSQILCCVSCAVYIKKRVPMLCLGPKWRVFDWDILVRTFSYGITSALQLMCVQLGKLFIQTIVNTQGIAFMAAYTAVNKVDDFALTPQQNIAHAATTFMAQNRGAGQLRRMKQGFFRAAGIEAVYTLVILLTVLALANPITQAFVGEGSTEVVALGTAYLHRIAFMYLLSGTTNIMQGFFRGLGDLKITLISTGISISVRVAAAFFLVNGLGQGFESLAWANFWGWMAMLAFEATLLARSLRHIGEEEKQEEEKG